MPSAMMPSFKNLWPSVAGGASDPVSFPLGILFFSPAPIDELTIIVRISMEDFFLFFFFFFCFFFFFFFFFFFYGRSRPARF